MSLPPEVLAELRALAERRLGAAEFNAYVDAPMSEGERQATLDLVDWFTRRYPTPGERLRAGRRSWAHARALLPDGRSRDKI